MSTKTKTKIEAPRCIECGNAMKSTREPHRYSVAGDWAITLQAVPVNRCPKCGYSEIGIERPDALHRTVVHAVIRKRGGLAGPEVVFLRQHLGMSARVLARTLGVTAVSISRWERGHQQIGAVPDRLLRALVALAHPEGETFPVDVFEAIEGASKPLRIVVEMTRKGKWHLAA